MKRLELLNLLCENHLVILQIPLNRSFGPLLTKPALCAVKPVCTLFDVFVAENTRENDFIHVAGHRVLNKKLIRHLVDAHEHEGQLACRSILLLFGEILLSSLPLTFNFEVLLLVEEIFLNLGFVLLLVKDLSELLGIQFA